MKTSFLYNAILIALAVQISFGSILAYASPEGGEDSPSVPPSGPEIGLFICLASDVPGRPGSEQMAGQFANAMRWGHPELEVHTVDGTSLPSLTEGLRGIAESGGSISRLWVVGHGASSFVPEHSDASKLELMSEMTLGPNLPNGHTILFREKPATAPAPGHYLADEVFQPIQGRFSDGAKVFFESCELASGDLGSVTTRKAQSIVRALGLENGTVFLSKTPVKIGAVKPDPSTLALGATVGSACVLSSSLLLKRGAIPKRIGIGLLGLSGSSVTMPILKEAMNRATGIDMGTHDIFSKQLVRSGRAHASGEVSFFEAEREFSNVTTPVHCAAKVLEFLHPVTGATCSLNSGSEDSPAGSRVRRYH